MHILEPKLKLRVLGQGIGLPETAPLDNVDILRMHPETRDKPDAFLQVFAKKIESGFGQGRRRMIRRPGDIGNPSEPTAEDLAQTACRAALAKTPEKKPGAFVLGSTTSARYTGSQAAAVLGKLGHHAPAFEIKAGCSTSQASLLYAYSLLQLGYPDVLVTCTETLSKTVHPDVKETWFGFADGAAAVWLEKDEKNPHFEVEKACFQSDGEHVDLYTVPGRMPPLREEFDQKRYFISGDSAEMKIHALERYVRMIDAILPSAEERKAVHCIIPHQVNIRLIEEVVAQTGMQDTPMLWDSKEHGNIGGASILFSFAKALEAGRFKPGDRVLLISVGGGLNFGAQVLRFIG